MGLEIIECGCILEDKVRQLVNKLSILYKDDEALLYVGAKVSRETIPLILIDKNRGIAVLNIISISPKNNIEVDFKLTNEEIKIEDRIKRLQRKFSLVDKKLRNYPLLTDKNKNLIVNLNKNLIIYKAYKNELYAYYQANGKSNNLTLRDIFPEEKPIAEYDVEYIRSIINPEIRIIESTEKININPEIEKNIKVLDYEQERFAKQLINGPYVLRGVPGSGKTVILLARALFVAKMHPDWKIGIFCYTNALTHDLINILNSRKEELETEGVSIDNIAVSTIHKKMTEIVPEEIIKKYKPEEKDYPDKQSYEKDREFYFYEQLPSLANKYVQAEYDAIFIDEYQDYLTNWMNFAVALCKKHNEKQNIFLAGDELQEIYFKDDSYNFLDYKIKRFTPEKEYIPLVLKFSYRTDRHFIETALQLLRSDKNLIAKVDKYYNGDKGISTYYENEDVKFITGSIEKIFGKVINLIKQGYKYKDIIILFPTNDLVSAAVEILNLNENSVDVQCIIDNMNTEKKIKEDKLNLSTYHSAKGLERKVCILANFEMVESIELAYMAITRASEQLYIHSTNFENGNLSKLIKTIVETKMYLKVNNRELGQKFWEEVTDEELKKIATEPF